MLDGKHEAIYADCPICRSLHVVAPKWLEEAYANAEAADALDMGAAWRNRVLERFVIRMGRHVPPGRWLDYGSGQGLLVASMRALGFDIHPHDPPRRIMAPAGTFAFVTCFEVLEHQVLPQAMLCEIADILHPEGTLALSTWLRDPSHGRDWSYLAATSGQHIAFASLRGLQAAASSAGLRWRCSAAHREQPQLQVHVLGSGDDPLSVEDSRSALDDAGFTVFASRTASHRGS